MEPGLTPAPDSSPAPHDAMWSAASAGSCPVGRLPRRRPGAPGAPERSGSSPPPATPVGPSRSRLSIRPAKPDRLPTSLPRSPVPIPPSQKERTLPDSHGDDDAASMGTAALSPLICKRVPAGTAAWIRAAVASPPALRRASPQINRRSQTPSRRRGRTARPKAGSAASRPSRDRWAAAPVPIGTRRGTCAQHDGLRQPRERRL